MGNRGLEQAQLKKGANILSISANIGEILYGLMRSVTNLGIGEDKHSIH
jgi:hypothetical protein